MPINIWNADIILFLPINNHLSDQILRSNALNKDSIQQTHFITWREYFRSHQTSFSNSNFFTIKELTLQLNTKINHL